MAKRQKNIEVLRVLSMFLIVVSHYIYHGLKNSSNHTNYDVSTAMGGKLCDNGIFVDNLMCCS